jgi:hypothetical protein
MWKDKAQMKVMPLEKLKAKKRKSHQMKKEVLISLPKP